MSPDRVIFSFVVGWAVLLVVLIVLDWLGNPSRGSFRPRGERPPRDRLTRKSERIRRRLEDDAAVRAALRDAYGASSLRLTWNGKQEDKVRQIDDALIVEDRAGVLDASSREVPALDHTAIIGDPLPNLAEVPLESPDADHDSPATTDEADSRSRGWRVGKDPLSPTARGDKPTRSTIRSRTWKNHSTSTAWSPENLARLRAGKAPTRRNPITGRTERGSVDLDTGRASWGDEPIDPFAEDA